MKEREYYLNIIEGLKKDYFFEEFLSGSKSYNDWWHDHEEELSGLGLRLACGCCREVFYCDSWDFVFKRSYDDEVDSCANELYIYEKAKKLGLDSVLAACCFVGSFPCGDIYAMEKCRCDEESMSSLSYDLQYSKFCEEEGYDEDDDEARDRFSVEYELQEAMFELAATRWGGEFASRVEHFFYENYVNDCHCGNWGWRESDGALVIVDYAGYGSYAENLERIRLGLEPEEE